MYVNLVTVNPFVVIILVPVSTCFSKLLVLLLFVFIFLRLGYCVDFKLKSRIRADTPSIELSSPLKLLG